MIKPKIQMKSIIFILIGILIKCFDLYGIQKLEWQGRVEERDGVSVVINPKEPLYGEIELELEEDLSIGKTDNYQYLFYRVNDVAVDEEGNIYVADMLNKRIQKYDPSGIYQLTIGRGGQGPGEFEFPQSIRIDKKTGNLYVKDWNRAIEIFNSQGEHIKLIKSENIITDFYIIDNENFLGVFTLVSESGLEKAILKMNSEGKNVGEYFRFPTNEYYKKIGQGVSRVWTGFESETYMARINNNEFIIGCSKDYEFYVIDEEGKPILRVKKEGALREFSPEFKRAWKKVTLGDYMPCYFSFLVDDKERIYIVTSKIEDEDGPMQIEIFNKDGLYLYKTQFPNRTFVIQKGFLYSYIVDDNEGMEYIKRYKIKNWDQIKRGFNPR